MTLEENILEEANQWASSASGGLLCFTEQELINFAKTIMIEAILDSEIQDELLIMGVK